MNKCHTPVLQNVDPTWNQDIIRTINQLYCEPHSELSIQELVKISSDTWEYWLEPILGEVQMIMQLLMTQIKIVTLMSIFNFHVHYTHTVECIKKISTSNSLFLHNWCSWSVKLIRSSDILKSDTSNLASKQSQLYPYSASLVILLCSTKRLCQSSPIRTGAFMIKHCSTNYSMFLMPS